jgi:ATP-binding cassette subfamily C protein
VVLLIIFIRIFPSIGLFQNQVQEFAGLIPSFRHYRSLLADLKRHEEAPMDEGEGPRLQLRQRFELRNVSIGYGDGKPVLRNASMLIEKGTLTSLGGHSGAGKSTLADVATGLLAPQFGGLYLDGRLLDETERLRWRRETSVVPQECFLFDDTIRGNLLCVKPDATEEELWQVLESVNSREFVAAREHGLDAPVGERGNLLSGGERQRISIARALLRSPQLLVLDEPTNNLDRDSERALLDVLENLKTKTTLLVISHDQDILDRADRVFHLKDGVVTASRDRSNVGRAAASKEVG